MRGRTGALGAFVALVLLGGLVGCTDDGPPAPAVTSSASGRAATSDLAKAAEAVTGKYLTQAAPTALATVRGTVRDGAGNDVSGTLDLLEVQAGPTSTVIRWRLSSDQPIRSVSTNYYNESTRTSPDTSSVALIAKQANLRMVPAVWKGTEPDTADCTCAWVPQGLDRTGVELSNLYPVLPVAVTEIELKVPGFPALAGTVSRTGG